MTKSELETELHNTRTALKEVLDYAFLTAIASEHFAYAFYLQEKGEHELVEQNGNYAMQALKESYELMPSEAWAKKIGYLWDVVHTGSLN